MNSQEISKLWFKCYGEDLKTEYSGFYNKLTKLEKTIKEYNSTITFTFGGKGGWKPMESKDGCAWFGGKTHSTLADYLPEEALKHNHEDLDFLVVAWRKA